MKYCKVENCNNKSGVTGVAFDKKNNQWIGHIRSNGKRIKKTFNFKNEAILYRKYLEEMYVGS